MTRITDELKTGIVTNQLKLSMHATSNCWICEGWTCVNFEFKPKTMQ